MVRFRYCLFLGMLAACTTSTQFAATSGSSERDSDANTVNVAPSGSETPDFSEPDTASNPSAPPGGSAEAGSNAATDANATEESEVVVLPRSNVPNYDQGIPGGRKPIGGAAPNCSSQGSCPETKPTARVLATGVLSEKAESLTTTIQDAPNIRPPEFRPPAQSIDVRAPGGVVAPDLRP